MQVREHRTEVTNKLNGIVCGLFVLFCFVLLVFVLLVFCPFFLDFILCVSCGLLVFVFASCFASLKKGRERKNLMLGG